MRRALPLLVVSWLVPALASAQVDPSERHPEEHELVAVGPQLRLGHILGDNAAWDLGIAGEVAGVIDLRYNTRGHWHIRLALFAALSSDRSDFSRDVAAWRVGVRLFPVAVGFGSDLVALRVGAEVGVTEVTYINRFPSPPPPPRGGGPVPMPTPTVLRTSAEVHFGPTIELAFEVRDGVEVMIYGVMPIVPVVYGEYGVSLAWLFF